MITLLHPSRGRAYKAIDTANYWFDRARNVNNIEYIISIDYSDRYSQDYISNFDRVKFANKRLLINHNESVVQATNKAAEDSKGDILIYLSDDFHCPDHWDDHILRESSQINNKEWLLKIDDGLQKIDSEVLTMPIMNRNLYKRLGYFWHPDYKSMWVDVDLFFTCKQIRAIFKAPNLLFQHNHYCNGKAKKDETYTRSESNWHEGKAVMERRKSEGFPI